MSGAVSMRTIYFAPKLARGLRDRCFVMNVSALLRELLIHACKFPRLSKRVPEERRIIGMIVDQLSAAGSIPLQLPQPSDARAARIVRALVADPSEQKTLERYCRESGASKRTVQRLFVAETGMTFEKWRQQLRLLCAMERLALGQKVVGVALDCGYESASAFISMFRKQLGATPGRYFKS